MQGAQSARMGKKKLQQKCRIYTGHLHTKKKNDPKTNNSSNTEALIYKKKSGISSPQKLRILNQKFN